MKMVNSVTNLGRNGIKDWIIQRCSAVVLAAYAIFLFCFILSHGPLHYATWQALFACVWMKWFTLLALLSLIAHAWVGIWTILTDYVHCAYARSALLVIFVLAFFWYLLWVIHILWG